MVEKRLVTTKKKMKVEAKSNEVTFAYWRVADEVYNALKLIEPLALNIGKSDPKDPSDRPWRTERAVADFLIKQLHLCEEKEGLSALFPNDHSEIRTQISNKQIPIIESPIDLDVNWIIHRPFGGSLRPDIIIVYKGFIFCIEVKGDDGRQTISASGLHPFHIYVHHINTHDYSHVYWGSEEMDPTEHPLLKDKLEVETKATQDVKDTTSLVDFYYRGDKNGLQYKGNGVFQMTKRAGRRKA